MKRRITASIITLLLVFTMAIPASAVQTYEVVQEQAITESVEPRRPGAIVSPSVDGLRFRRTAGGDIIGLMATTDRAVVQGNWDNPIIVGTDAFSQIRPISVTFLIPTGWASRPHLVIVG
ncbi:MAG: hypothetical protein FWC13_13030 [Oscillospiraceae bacterium]|nr:hypothetical protein [Oscillospiraceae bacterium]